MKIRNEYITILNIWIKENGNLNVAYENRKGKLRYKYFEFISIKQEFMYFHNKVKSINKVLHIDANRFNYRIDIIWDGDTKTSEYKISDHKIKRQLIDKLNQR